MQYHLSFFNGTAFIERRRKRKHPDVAWLAEDGSAAVNFPLGLVTARFEHLTSFAASLPLHVETLNDERRQNPKRCTTCMVGNGEISFSTDASKAVRQFVRILHRIWPLFEIARTMLEQMKHCPLTTNVSVEIFVPKQEINDVSAKQFLESRKEAALKIDPATALISRSYVYALNPYGVYSRIPEICKDVFEDYYACAPGSNIWVYSQDLPEDTRCALEKKHKLDRRLAAYSY
jgi:hypothetical protein